MALVIGFLSSLMLTISSHTQKDDFPVLRGPYLGQKPKGKLSFQKGIKENMVAVKKH